MHAEGDYPRPYHGITNNELNVHVCSSAPDDASFTSPITTPSLGLTPCTANSGSVVSPKLSSIRRIAMMGLTSNSALVDGQFLGTTIATEIGALNYYRVVERAQVDFLIHRGLALDLRQQVGDQREHQGQRQAEQYDPRQYRTLLLPVRFVPA